MPKNRISREGFLPNTLPYLMALCFPLLACDPGGGETSLPDEVESGQATEVGSEESELWATSNLWPGGRVDICWEASTLPMPEQRRWTVEAFESTWGRVANVTLNDLGRCDLYRFFNCKTPGSTTCDAVQIHFADVTDAPNVSGGLGRVEGGGTTMTLNPTFRNWGSANCAGRTEYCFRSVAAHEWGHVLGFAHEHNRGDRPDYCIELPQGSNGTQLLTEYDFHSMMNYCAPWNGLGELSPGDQEGVTRLYGAKRVPYFFYNQMSLKGSVSFLDANGVYSSASSMPNFGIWSHIVTTGAGHLFFYDSTRGEGVVSRIDSNGQYKAVSNSIPGFSKGFTHVTAVGRNNVVFYNQQTGALSISQVTDTGAYYGKSTRTLSQTWTDVVGLRNGHLFLFNRPNGQAMVAFVNQAGEYSEVRSVFNFRTTWTSVTGVGSNALFFFDANTKTAATAHIDGEGTYHQGVSVENFGNWSHVVGGSNGALLFYNRYTGEGAFGRVDSLGRYTTTAGMKGFSTHHSIITGG